MAWTTPRTWVAAELVTAAIMNAQIAGNQNALAVAVKVRNSVNITVSSNAWTGLTFDTEDYDIDGMHSTAVNSSRLTCNTPGQYEFGGVAYGSTANLLGAPRILRNGSTAIADVFGVGVFRRIVMSGSSATSSATNYSVQIQAQNTLTTGQYLTFQVYGFSGGDPYVSAIAPLSPVFWARWVSAT